MMSRAKNGDVADESIPHPARNNVLLLIILWPKGLSANAIHTEWDWSFIIWWQVFQRPTIHVW